MRALVEPPAGLIASAGVHSTAWPGRRNIPTEPWRFTSTTACATSRAGRAAGPKDWVPGPVRRRSGRSYSGPLTSRTTGSHRLRRQPGGSPGASGRGQDSDSPGLRRQRSDGPASGELGTHLPAVQGARWSVERVVKPGADHHPHGLTYLRPIVEFFDRAWQERGKAPDSR